VVKKNFLAEEVLKGTPITLSKLFLAGSYKFKLSEIPVEVYQKE
jgi:hypothetical protein